MKARHWFLRSGRRTLTGQLFSRSRDESIALAHSQTETADVRRSREEVLVLAHAQTESRITRNIARAETIALSDVQGSSVGAMPTIDALTITFETATPEQIGMYLVPTRGIASPSTVAVRFKRSVDSSWTQAHPLLRISTANDGGGPATIIDAFAGSIFDLTPGTQYDLELTHSESGQQVKQTILTGASARTTRSLPGAAAVSGSGTQRTANSVATIGTQFAAVNPGDVLTIADGTYNVSGLTLSRSGTSANPIYIRGASQLGTVLVDTTGDVLAISASYVVLENLTIQGSSTDTGTTSSPSLGIHLTGTNVNVTVRDLTMVGVDRAINADNDVTGCLVYRCVLNGNNQWSQYNTGVPPSGQAPNYTWNDDGVNLPGSGNCAWENTLYGFGDCFSCAQHSGSFTGNDPRAIYYYRNHIRMTGDDAFEADYGHRNIGFYDNIVTNCGTLLSLDPLFGGPLYCFRNVAVNTTRGPFKIDAMLTGFLIYNNTVVRTDGLTGWDWVLYSGADLENYSFRNNLMIWRGSGSNMLAIEAQADNNPCDFSHNAWYPNGNFGWNVTGGGRTNWGSLSAAQTAMLSYPVSPLFGSTTQRHANDIILTASNPFANAITLGSNHLTEYTGIPDPTLSAGTNARSAGVAIPNITDGGGATPDIGARITGRPVPTYGAPATFPLSIHASGRYLVDATGQPFLVHGDTPWSLPAGATDAEVDSYIDDRAAKGFTAILFEAPVIYFTPTGSTNNVDGQAPFTSMAGNWNWTLNSAYWARVDRIVNRCKAKGILCIINPAYLGYSGTEEGCDTEVAGSSDATLQAYGATLAQRYAQGNVMWCFGGDQNPGAALETKQWQIVVGIRSVRTTDLITAHGAPQSPSYTTWNGQVGYNINTAYPGFGAEDTVYSHCLTEYGRAATPFFMIEAGYEQEHQPDTTDSDLRRQSYTSYLAGAMGQMFGNNPIWNWGSPNALFSYTGTPASNLNSTGSVQQRYVKQLMSAYAWWKLVPQNASGGANIVSSPALGSGAARIQPAVANDGSFALIWVPSSQSVTVNLDAIASAGVRARLYNPTDGTYTTVSGSPFASTGTQAIATGGERVIVLDEEVGYTTQPLWLSTMTSTLQWKQLTGAGISSAEWGVAAFSGGGYDPVTHRLLVFGGGHLDSSDNGVYAVNLSLDAPTGTNVNARSGSAAYENIYNTGGKPAARHSYEHCRFNHALGKLMCLGGAAYWGDGNTNSGVVDAFDSATNTWSTQGTYATFSPVAAGFNASGVCFDSAGNGYLLSSDNNNLYKWTRSGGASGAPGSWSSIGSNPGSPLGYRSLAYDSTRNRILFVAGSSSCWWDLSAGNARTTLSFSVGTGIWFRYVPDFPGGDCYLGIGYPSMTIHKIDAATFAYSTLTVGGTQPSPPPDYGGGYSNGNGQYHGRWDVCTDYGVMILLPQIKDYAGNVWNPWVFRYK